MLRLSLFPHATGTDVRNRRRPPLPLPSSTVREPPLYDTYRRYTTPSAPFFRVAVTKPLSPLHELHRALSRVQMTRPPLCGDRVPQKQFCLDAIPGSR